MKEELVKKHELAGKLRLVSIIGDSTVNVWGLLRSWELRGNTTHQEMRTRTETPA